MDGCLVAERFDCIQDDYDSALHQISDILQGPSYDRRLEDFNLPLPEKSRNELIAFQQIEQIITSERSY
jgi:hypothetical protein